MNLIFQRLLLWTYRNLPMRSILATPFGRSAFERSYVFYKQWIEAPGADHLRSFVLKGQWVIDVGANIGFFTDKFASWVSEGGRVIAIEPESLNFARLIDRMRRAGHEQVVIGREAAAAASDGTLFLARSEDYPGDHSVSDTAGSPVAARRIDSLVAELGNPPVGMIKIDTEGAEMRTLAGASETIARCRPVLVVEVDDAALRAHNTSAAQLIDAIAGLDYSFAVLTRNGVEPLSANELRARLINESSGYLDVVCRPREHAEG